jgi:hypothetical protein
MNDTLSATDQHWHQMRAEQMMSRLLARQQEARRRRKDADDSLATRIATTWNLAVADVVRVVEVIKTFGHSDAASHYRSIGGEPEVLAINMDHCEAFHAGGEFPEYASFADDPVIGSRWIAHPDDALLMTLGHELAHHVATLVSAATGESIQPHGAVFQAAYRLIREHGVNPMLDENGSPDFQRQRTRHELRLRRKLQALKRMAEDDRSNRNEAERAVAQLTHLMQKHGIDDLHALEQRPVHFVERYVPVVSRGNFKPLLHICFDVARFCGVEALIHSTKWLNGTLRGDWRSPPAQCIGYFGAPQDVDMAVYLSELIEDALQRELASYRQSDGYQRERARGRHAGTLNASFRQGYLDTLKTRLRAARDTVEKNWQAEQPKASSIMVQHNAALQAALQDRYPRVGTARQRTNGRARSRSARHAASSAAQRFNLNRPVHARRTPLLNSGS